MSFSGPWFTPPVPPTQHELGASWDEIDRDETYKVKLITYRCRACKRLAVGGGGYLPSTCVCKEGR